MRGILFHTLPGARSGLRSKSAGLVLLQAGAELPGRLDARVEEEKSGRCLQKNRRGCPSCTFLFNCLSLGKSADLKRLLLFDEESQVMLSEKKDDTVQIAMESSKPAAHNPRSHDPR